MNDIVCTVQYARVLENLPMEVLGVVRKAARRGEVQDHTKPARMDCGLCYKCQ